MTLSQITLMYEISKPIYNEILRPILADHVNTTETEVDDAFLSLCDIVFHHDKKQSQVKLFYSLAQKIYFSNLRTIMIEAIKTPKTEIDDFVIKMYDLIFQYKELK